FIDLMERMAIQRLTSFDAKRNSALQNALSLDPKRLGFIALPGGIIESHSAMSHEETDAVNTSIWHLQDHLTIMHPGTSDYRECLRELVESYRAKISVTNGPTDVEE